jgi:hypothetical protein
MTLEHDDNTLRVFNVLHGEASRVRSTPFGDVGSLFSGSGIELVWVRKQDEPIDEDWFCSDEVDLILVIQGQLKFEFEALTGGVLTGGALTGGELADGALTDNAPTDLVLDVGDVLVLPAGQRCRAYRWPRDARTPTVFVAAYPVPGSQ